MTPIVLLICTLSQVAALLYISWTYILELGLKPDLVLRSKGLKDATYVGWFWRRLGLRLVGSPPKAIDDVAQWVVLLRWSCE